MPKNLKLVLLLDYYGELLTKKQRGMLELYYCDDLSLAEIAEGESVTRQAVRDSIKRGEQQLLELEEKLGIAQRHAACKEKLAELLAHAAALQAADADRMSHLTAIRDCAAACEAML